MSPNSKKNKKKNSKQKADSFDEKLTKSSRSKPSSVKKSESPHSVFSSQDLQALRNALKVKDLTNLSLVIGAVILNKMSLTQELVRQGCNVNENGPNQTTALMWAVQAKSTDIMEFLLSNGADPTAKNKKGDNVLFIALENKLWDENTYVTFWNHVKSIAFVDVDFTGRNGDNMVHIAVRRQWNELLNILISEKANVNAADCKATTPLMLACYFNNQDIVLSLLQAKANVLKEDRNKCTAVCYSIFHVINKNVPAPHLVVDKLIDVMAGSKISFLHFFKTLLKSILNEPLKQKVGHPLSSVKLSVIPYALRYKKETLRTVMQVAKSSLGEPFMMKQFLIILNDMLRYQQRYFGPNAMEEEVMERFIALGAADICLKILKMEDVKWDMPTLGFHTLINLCAGHTAKAAEWLDKEYQEVTHYYDEYLKCHPRKATDDLEDASNEKLLQFHDLMVKIRLENSKLKNLYINDTVQRESTPSGVDSLTDPKISKVKRQRRAKVLKANITKIRSADLTERLNISKKHNAWSPEPFEQNDFTQLTFCKDEQYEIKSQQPYDCAWKQIWSLGVNSPFMKQFRESVNYLGTKLIHDDCDDMFDIKIDPASLSTKPELILNKEEVWKSECEHATVSAANDDEAMPKQTKSEPIFHKNVKSKTRIDKEDIKEMMTYSIKYLSSLLNKILSTYKNNWKNDKRQECAGQCGLEADTEGLNDMEWIMEKVEMGHIERIQKQFDSLDQHLHSNAYINTDLCHKALEQLEGIFLNHRIRGCTIQSEVPVQIIDIMESNKESAKKKHRTHNKFFPTNVEDLWEKTKPMCDFYEMDLMGADQLIQEEQYSSDSNNEFNASYLIEFLRSPRKSPSSEKSLKDKMNTMRNAYHLIPSIIAVCDDDDAAEDALMQQQEKDRQDRILTKLRTRQSLQESLSEVHKAKGPQKMYGFIDETDNDKPICTNIKSRWSNIITNLQLADDCKFLTNSSIRIHDQNQNLQPFSSGGNFNPVVLGLDKRNNPLAVKQIDKDNSVCKVLKTLINPLLGLRNTNLLHYYTCTYEDNYLILTTPLCEYNMGEYIMLMKQNPDLIVKHVDIARQIFNGLRFLHNRTDPIVHGNLKPSNIFIDVNGIVRIGEFGMHGALYTLSKAPNTSIIWFSRETFNIYKNTSRLACTCSSDIQVAGMLIHFVLTAGMHPYGETMQDILMNLENGLQKLVTKNVDVNDLISWMLMYEPSERPSINQVLSHVFFWYPTRKWKLIVTCCGITVHGTPIKIEIDDLHTFIDSVASKEKITGKWITPTRNKYPDLNYGPYDDSITGLLTFIASYVVNQTLLGCYSNNEFRNFILSAFPALPLSLYRVLESSHWLNHSHLQPFTTDADSYLA